MIFSPPLAFIMDRFQQWIIALNGGAKSVIGGVIGACMGFDLGGPINKTASLAANALGADGINGPMAAKLVGGMTPPIGAFIATLLAKKKFAQAQIDTAKAAFPMGLCFITEGVLPFAAADPVRFHHQLRIRIRNCWSNSGRIWRGISCGSWRYFCDTNDDESINVRCSSGDRFSCYRRCLCGHQNVKR